MSAHTFFALGTASQVPTRSRNHNGYFLHWREEGFLLDPGEGTQRQMIFAGVSAAQITKIFITHFHGDHCLGLAGILQRISLDRVAHKVEIYYPAYGQKFVEALRNSSVYHNTAEIVEKPFHEEGLIFEDKTLKIGTMKLDHSLESWGYRFDEKDDVTMLPEELEKYGIRGRNVGTLKTDGKISINGETVLLEEVSKLKKGLNVAFLMDTRLCENAFRLAENADVLISESTYLEAEKSDAEKNAHLTAKQAAEIAQKSNIGKLILTHFSQRYVNTEDFEIEAKTIHAESVAVKDGEKIELLRRN